MRKTTAKLALHKETVRELSRKELSYAAGGTETDAPADAVPQSRDKQCLAAAVAGDSRDTCQSAGGPELTVWPRVVALVRVSACRRIDIGLRVCGAISAPAAADVHGTAALVGSCAQDEPPDGSF